MLDLGHTHCQKTLLTFDKLAAVPHHISVTQHFPQNVSSSSAQKPPAPALLPKPPVPIGLPSPGASSSGQPPNTACRAAGHGEVERPPARLQTSK